MPSMKRRLAPLCLSLLVGVPLAATLPGGSIVVAILGISFLIFVHEWGEKGWEPAGNRRNNSIFP